VGANDTLGTFYRPEGDQERGQQGMCLKAMLNLQCVSFGVEGEPGAETAKGMRGDEACVSKEDGRCNIGST
jgi:hypothetical protein